MASIFHECVDLQALADEIVKQFTPMAFTCKCDGQDPDCAGVLESPSAWAQKTTADRIAEYIRGLKP